MIELLNLTEWYGISENIEIAKGKFKIPETIKEATEQSKRIWHARKLLK